VLPSARARVAARSTLATFGGLGGALKCLQLFTQPLAELGLSPAAIVGLGVAQLLAAAAVVPPGRARAPAAALMLVIGLIGTAALVTAPSGGPVLALMSLVVPVLAVLALLPDPPEPAPAAPAPGADPLVGEVALDALPIEQSGRAPRPERDRGPQADWAAAVAGGTSDDDEDDDNDGTPPPGRAAPVRPRGPW
jgi:hypothetical protein